MTTSSSGPTKSNLDLAIQLAAVLTEITNKLQEQTEIYRRHAQLVEAICKGQECANELDPSKLKEITDGLRQAREQTEKFGSKTEEAVALQGLLGEAVEKTAAWAKKLSVPQEFLNGFKAGFNLSTNMLSSIMRLGGTALGLLKNIGMILLSVPGRLLDLFQQGSGGADEYAQALEEVRKEFGDLSVGTSAAIKGMTESIKNFSESGLAFSKVYGYGRAGMAAFLRENLELAKGMGSGLFKRLAASIGENSREFTIMRKAMALSAEGLKSMVIAAEGSGKSMADATREMMIKVAQAGRTFNMTSKEIGRDIDAMLKDTATFGRVAPDAMIKTSVYVKKLGISIETLKKVMDKSLNFEDAAQQAASLSEAFNMNIDAMKLMKEQDPTKKLDMIRESFFRTGRSVEQLSIAEMKALQNTTGLSDEELRLSFSQKNRSMNQAQLNEQMKKGQKQQISQAEAMKDLAKSIERLIQSGSGMKGGFFEIFMKGFELGIRRSREFRHVVRNLQRSMRAVYHAGIQVGRMFVQMFPGMRDILGGLADMFNPTRFRNLMSKVKDTFREFFTMLQSDPKAGFENFMKRMKENFIDFFNAGSPAGSRFLNGLRKFYETVGVIFVQGLKYGLQAIAEAMKGIVGYLKNPASLSSIASSAGSGIKGAFIQAFTYALTELRPVLGQIGAAFSELFHELYTRYIQPRLRSILLGAFVFMFGPAIVMGMVRGIFAGIMMTAMPMILARMRGEATRVAETTSGAAGRAAAAGETTEATVAERVRAAAAQMKKLSSSLLTFVIAISAIVAVIILLAAMASALEIDPTMVLTVFLLFSGVALLMTLLLKLKFFDLVMEFGKTVGENANAASEIGKGLLAMGAILLSIALIVTLGSALLSAVDSKSVETFLTVMKSMTLVLIGVAITTGVLAAIGAGLSGPQVALVLGGLVFAGIMMLAIAGFAAVALPQFMSSMSGVSPEFAKAMVEVLDTFVNMIVKISAAIGILSLSAPFAALGSILTLFTGKNPLDAVTEVLSKIVKAAQDVITSLNGLTGDPNLIAAKAQIFSTVASGLASLIGPITELLGDISDDFFASGSADAAAAAATSIISVIEVLAKPNEGIIPKLMEQIKGIAETTTVDSNKMKAAAEVFTAIATGVSEIIKAVAEMMQTFDSGLLPAINPVMLIGQALSMAIKLAAMSEIANTLLPTIKTLMTDITREVVNLSSTITNVEAVKAMGPLLGSISQVVGTVLTNITKLVTEGGGTGFMDTIRNIFSERDAVEELRDRLTEISIFITTISLSLTNFLRSIFSALLPIVNNAPTDAAKIKGLSVVSEILKSTTSMIAPIVQAIGSLITNVKADKDITEAKIREVGYQVTMIISSVVTNMGTMFDNIPTLVTKLSTIPIPSGLETKVKALAGIFDLIKSVSSIIANFTVQGTGGVSRQLNVITEVFDPVMSLLTNLFSDPVNSAKLVAVINALSGRQFANVRTAGERAKGIKNLFEGIKAVAEAVKSLTELSTTATIDSRFMDQTMTNIATVIAGVSKTEYNGVQNPFLNSRAFSNLSAMRRNLKGKTELVNEIRTNLTNFIGAVNGVAGINVATDISTQIQTKIENLFTALERVGNYFSTEGAAGLRSTQIDTIMTRVASNLSGPLMRNVRGMVTAYNQFVSELSDMQNLGAINASVSRVGTRLGSLRQLEIQRGTMNMKLTINVKIDAGDVTQALYSWNTQNNNNTRGGQFSTTAFNPMTETQGPQ